MVAFAMPTVLTREQVDGNRGAGAPRARCGGTRSVRAAARRHPRLRRSGAADRHDRRAADRESWSRGRPRIAPTRSAVAGHRRQRWPTRPTPIARASRAASSRFRGSSDERRRDGSRAARRRSARARARRPTCAATRSRGSRRSIRRCTPSTPSSPSRRWRARARSTTRSDRWRDAPLAGVPVALKDNLCTRGVRTTASSRMLERYVPPYDATVVVAARRRRRGRSSARPTATSSRWARRTRTRRSGRRAIRGRSIAFPAASSGGSAAAVAARHGAARARLRHRRLDPPAGRALRRRRAQADLRPRVALRADRVRLVARSDRTADANGARRRAGAGRDRRRRSRRCDQRARAGARLHRRAHRRRPRRCASACRARCSSRASTPTCRAR